MFEGQTLPYFNIYYKAIITKTLLWEVCRSMEQNSPETNPHKYVHLVFDKGGKVVK